MTSPSAHERYRSRLAALESDGPLLPALMPDAGPWRRRYARFDPGRAPYATFVLEASEPQRLVCIEVFARPPLVAPARPVTAGEVGFVVATRFPADDGLPTLPAVLAEAAPATVLRYHPGRRCTIHCPARNMFAKVFADARGEAIHATAVALFEASRAGGLGFAVARPERYDAGTRACWQEEAAGAPVTERLRAGDAALTGRIGAAVASLGAAAVSPRAVFDARAQLDRTERHLDELAARVPLLADDAATLLARLADLHAAAGDGSLRPIHGAPRAGQWLDADGRLALLDFDRAALGPAEHDAAAFVADLDAEDPDRVPVEQLTAAFVAGFESVAGPLDPRRLAACRAQWHVAKALRAARAVREDGDRRAERRLRATARLVAEVPA
jgi:hypothetical protein